MTRKKHPRTSLREGRANCGGRHFRTLPPQRVAKQRHAIMPGATPPAAVMAPTLYVVPLLLHSLVHLPPGVQAVYSQEVCLCAMDPLTARGSCQEVLDTQPDCHGHSGPYWLSEGGGPVQVHCDMSHSGGGWRRVVSFHHDHNESCPTAAGNEITTPGWEGLTLSNGSTYCLRGGWDGGEDGRTAVWNSNRSVSYSEIRGYLQLRLLSLGGEDGTPDGFAGPGYDIWDDDYADGLSVEIPEPHLRHIYSYVLGSSENKCPQASGTASPPYLLQSGGAYVCGHINTLDEVDDDGVYQILPHTPGGSACQNCPSGSPWFEKQLGETLNHPVQLRFLGHHDDWGIAVAEVELYVR